MFAKKTLAVRGNTGMKALKRNIFIVSALAAVLVNPSTAHATLLSALFSGATITTDYQTYSNFTFNSYIANVGPAFDNGINIDVTGLSCGGCLNPGPGLSFNILNGAFNFEGNGTYAYLDLNFSFMVTADPGLSIEDNTLQIASATLGYQGSGSQGSDGEQNRGIQIKEWMGPVPADGSGAILTNFSQTRDSSIINLSATSNFAPSQSYLVTIEVLAWASSITDITRLFSFTTRFSHDPDWINVPEPSTLGLLGLGLTGVGFARRKKAGITSWGQPT